MKKTAAALGLAILCMLTAYAADFAALEPKGYVSDYSGVIDPQTRTALEAYCAGLEAKTGVQIAVLTLPTLQGEPIEDVANDIFRRWGIGKKTSDEGLLLLLVTRDRRMRIEVGYGLEPIIPDGAAGGVLRSMAPALRESRYGDAVTEGLREIGERIAAAKGVTLDGGLPPKRAPRRSSRSSPIPVLLGVLALLWFLGAMGGGRRGGRGGFGGRGGDVLTGMILGNMLGRSMGGSRWGGGFGGFDSGGGFGGFGGGSSGGGGASGSW